MGSANVFRNTCVTVTSAMRSATLAATATRAKSGSNCRWAPGPAQIAPSPRVGAPPVSNTSTATPPSRAITVVLSGVSVRTAPSVPPATVQ